MANKELEALLEKLAALDKDELSSLTKQANALKRDRKAKADRAALAGMFKPLFDAIDKVIASNPKLQAHIADKDAIRVYFDENHKVNRDTYRSYGQRDVGGKSAGSNGTTVWEPAEDAEGKYHIEYASGRAMCNAHNIPNNGASFRVDAKTNKLTFVDEKPEGRIVEYVAG